MITGKILLLTFMAFLLFKSEIEAADEMDLLAAPVDTSKHEVMTGLELLKTQGKISEADYAKAKEKLHQMNDSDMKRLKEKAHELLLSNPVNLK